MRIRSWKKYCSRWKRGLDVVQLDEVIWEIIEGKADSVVNIFECLMLLKMKGGIISLYFI